MTYFQCGPLMTCGGFRVGGGVHDSYTFQCEQVGSFTSPGIDTRQKGPTAFSVSPERHWQSGVNGIAKVPKRKVFTAVGVRTRPGAQAKALTHSATAPQSGPLCHRNNYCIHR